MSKKIHAANATTMQKHILEAERQVRLGTLPLYHDNKTDKKLRKKLHKAAELLTEINAIIVGKRESEKF